MNPIPRTTPLRRRLFLLAAAGIVPLAATAAIGLYAMFAQQRGQAERAALEITRALSTAMDAELRRSLAALEVLAASGSSQVDDLDEFREALALAMAARDNWRGLVLSDTAGRQILNTAVAPGEPLPATVDVESVGRVARTGRPVMGPLVHVNLAGWTVPVRVPILREGKVAYVLTAVVTPESILDVALRQRLKDGWVVTATDPMGQRVVRWPSQDEYIGTPVSGTLRRMMESGRAEATGITTTSEGHEVYTAYSRSPETGWTVALGIPRGEVEAAAWRSLGALGSGLALSLLLGALATLVIARSVSRPMGELLRAAQSVGRGEPPEAVHSNVREIREVSDALVVSAAQRARAEADREELLHREQAARAAAEAANRAKDEFLAMLGHELRNPLGAASNAANLLRHPQLDARAREEAGAIIVRQIAHLARLTDDLLDAGRALLGKIVLRREPVDVAAAVAQCLATLAAAGRTHRHKVVEDLREAWVDVDPVRLDQIVSNLLVNAAKYTPEGGTIRVTVGREAGDTVLRVADDGIGLPPELAARVFDLFVQGDRDLDRAQGGLGIGLTLVRRLAELHGGSASVTSEGVDRGSEFTVRLPGIAAPAVEGRRESRRGAAARRILIVEDNADARETLRVLLELSGHDVETAGDGETGLEKALSLQPDVALLDIGLPKMDGYEVARRIRRAGGASRRPYLVALTGYGLPEDRERALAAGFDAHLVKPVDPGALESVLGLGEAGNVERVR